MCLSLENCQEHLARPLDQIKHIALNPPRAERNLGLHLNTGISATNLLRNLSVITTFHDINVLSLFTVIMGDDIAAPHAAHA